MNSIGTYRNIRFYRNERKKYTRSFIIYLIENNIFYLNKIINHLINSRQNHIYRTKFGRKIFDYSRKHCNNSLKKILKQTKSRKNAYLTYLSKCIRYKVFVLYSNIDFNFALFHKYIKIREK